MNCFRLSIHFVSASLISAVCVAAERPNILFIFTDDHAAHAIGAYGGWLSEAAPTPHLDELARQGMLFENCFCTNSICGPSRAVILTGKHSHLNGFRQNGDRFDGSQQTFPKLLQQVGYQTAMIGKWHLGTEPTGFDHWDVLPGQGRYYNPEFVTPEGKHVVEGHATDVVTDKAVAWLQSERRPDRPFMLMCQHKAPHRTWMPALRHLPMYAEEDLPEAPTLFDDYADNASPARHQEMTITEHLQPVYDLKLLEKDFKRESFKSRDLSGFENLRHMTPAQRARWDAHYVPVSKAFAEANLHGDELVRWKYQRYLKDYLRCIAGVDESVGRLRATLQELGLADNTIVIYSSDQGFYLGDHGWYDKRWMYEESLKMPLIAYWPGVTPANTRRDEMAQNLDFAETFLDIAGAPIPSDMQGRSLAPMLRGESPADWRDAIYYHYYEFPSVHMVARHYGLRNSRYKLIHFYQFDEWEFYDLENDPDELTNHYKNDEYQSTIARLKSELSQLRDHYGDETDIGSMPAEWQSRFR